MAVSRSASTDLLASLSADWRDAFRWLEQELGGRILSAERQPRWRPAWTLDLERAGETLPLYWRGERGIAEGINEIYDLDREERILRVLAEHGIPVPRIHAVCPEPRALVMDRCPGRPNLATAQSDAERTSVLDHYMEILASIHSIDPADFESVGIAAPPTDEVALGDFGLWEEIYRKAKRRPEPLIEFLVKWVRRQPPTREQPRFVLSDSGQFLFDRGRVTAILDVEFGYLGDPVADLAGLRAREIFEPLGDLSAAFRRYQEITGSPISRELLSWHTVRFALYTPLSIAHVVADPTPQIDWAQYRSFFIGQARLGLQGVAEAMGMEDIELEAAAASPEAPLRETSPRVSPHGSAHDALVELLRERRDSESDAVLAYESERALRIAEHLRRVEAIGPMIEAEEREDRSALLGHPVEVGAAADLEIEQLVERAGPERDEELLRYFQRRILREHELFRPAMREMEDMTAQSIEL